jgi:hypothetical protein
MRFLRSCQLIAAVILFSARKIGLENNFAGGFYSCTLQTLAAVESWFLVARSFFAQAWLIARPLESQISLDAGCVGTCRTTASRLQADRGVVVA